MALSFSLTQVERFRSEAKKLKRERSITHNEALDRIAQHNGFSNWSLLAKHSDTAIASTTAESLSESRDSRKRYYLHGDVVEGEPNKCYCARCDDFWNLDHFQPTSWHKDGNDVERFLYSLANWNKLTPSRKGNLYRPTKVPNVLQQAIEITRTLHEAARSPFHKWLESQINRNDQIGDLAKDVLRDKGLARAFYWQRLLDAGEVRSGTEIAKLEGLNPSTVNELLRIALLDPLLVQHILEGQYSQEIRMMWFTRNALPDCWHKQFNKVAN